MSRVVVIGATGHIGHVPRAATGGRRPRGDRDQPRHPRALPGEPAVGGGGHGDRRPGGGGRGGNLRDADRGAARRRGHRPDLLHRGVGPAAYRGAAPVAPAARALRDHLGARPRAAGAGDGGRAPTAYGSYGTGKAEIEALLHAETRSGGVPAVVLHPGHISGPGWPVITPAGNLDPVTWTALATGRPLPLPDNGLGVLHHVHADDVAQAFELALSTPAAIGGSFHVTADQAMTQRGLAAGVAQWFGREPALDFVGWDEFTRLAGPGPPRSPASTPPAASPRASPAPARCSATRRGTAHSTRCARPWPGWLPTARRTSAGSRLRRPAEPLVGRRGG